MTMGAYTDIYLEGTARPNPGRGAAIVVVKKEEDGSYHEWDCYRSNPAVSVSNVEMQLIGLIEALNAVLLDGMNNVRITCASKYLERGLSIWAPGWEASGWKSHNKPIKHLSLWKVAWALFQACGKEVTWVWATPPQEVRDLFQVAFERLIQEPQAQTQKPVPPPVS